MSVTQSVTPTPEEAGTPTPTSGIDNSFDEQGHQVVEDGVFNFDEAPSEVEETPLVTPAPGDEVEVEEVPVDPANPKESTIEEDMPGVTPAKPAEPVDPNKPVEPAKPAEEAKPVETELKVYADKFKTVQDLKNAFVQLGGDPAKFDGKTDMLEEAYRVRQTEFSKSRADIAVQNQVPVVPNKSFQELLQEEYAKHDPSKFEDPAAMWKASNEATAAAAAKFEAQQKQPDPTQVTPQEMDRQIKSLDEMHSIEAKVPRLKTDENFRKGFATHILVMKQEGRSVEKSKGVLDVNHAMQDYIKGQSALIEEANKSYNATQKAKTISTVTHGENAPASPSNAPSATPEDDILDGIIDAQRVDSAKYN